MDEQRIRAEVRAEIESEVRMELVQQWIKERDALILKLDQMIQSEVEKLRK